MLKKAKWPAEARRAAGLDALALAAGAGLNLAFAPVGQWWLAPVCLAVLYHLWGQGSPRRQALRGFLFGIGLFAVGVSWIYLTLVRFGGAPPAAALLGTACFMVILAAYPAAAGFVFARLRNRDAWDPWLFAALWTAGEWVRGFFLTGFPWLDAGYSLDRSPLLPWAPIIGVLGLGFLVALFGALAADVRSRPQPFFVLVVVLALGTPRIAALRLVHKVGAPLTVSLVQGDVSPTIKWDASSETRIIGHYLHLTRRAFGRLVIWPETAVPGYSHQLRRWFIPRMQQMAARNHRHFLLGVVEGNAWGDGPIYNAVLSIGGHDGFYRKQHLVPFGEYLPWPSVFGPILAVLHVPMSGFTPWTRPEHALVADGARIGVTICYEIAYGALVTEEMPAATVLVNVSDDSWYGHSNEAAQQLQIARLRAAEAGRDLAIATNDGQTAVIDHRGGVAARLPAFRPGVLTAVVQPYGGLTPYDRYGHMPVLVVCGLLILAGIIRRFTTVLR